MSHKNDWWYIFNAVDILEEVGLRDGNIIEDNATLAQSPDGSMNAFSLSTPLMAPTSSTEWDILASGFNRTFSLYTVLELSGYSGEILSIGSQFQLSIRSTTSFGLTSHTLLVRLPGIASPVEVDIPPQSGYQSLGLRIHQGRLVILLNCEVLDTLPLESQMAALNITDENVSIFDHPVIVSDMNLRTYNIVYSNGNHIEV